MKTVANECKHITKLPIGLYTGIWEGYTVTIILNGELWQLTTNDGIRGKQQVSVISTEKDIRISTYKN
jgi:hypothetical protein